MTARLSTHDETQYAIEQCVAREDCGRVTHGGNLDSEMRQVDREDFVVYLTAGSDLEHVEEYRRALRDWQYDREDYPS